jgi:muramoyltetrapeptide carboxypeptidase
MDSRRVLPRALASGDLVSVVSPASRPNRASLDTGVEMLRSRGLKVRVAPHALDSHGHLAGADRDRAADLMEAFLDPEVRAVLCARGGAGSARVIPYLDLEAIAAHPKVFVGYSDITALHLALARRAGWPTFYGPMVASEMDGRLDEECLGALWRMVSDPAPAGIVDPGACAPAIGLVPGIAEGSLAGGTLCVVESALATPYSIDACGKILMLEDAEEPLWRVDRMLTHLEHAGVLSQAAGFVVGSLSHEEETGAARGYLSVRQSVMEHLGVLGKPVLAGFPFGHIARPLTLPLGCLARLDAGAGTLTVLEPAVSPAR